MNKNDKLRRIEGSISQCKTCQKQTLGKPVPGEGSPNAEVVFIGEAPGREEAKTGRPFVGRSGQLLRKFIREIGLVENEVYITSPVKYLPRMGTPTPEMIVHGREHLKDQMNVIQPKIMVLLGRVACEAVLAQKVTMSKIHGKSIKKGTKTFFVTYHPAAALRFPQYEKALQEDFEKLKKLLGCRARGRT